MDILRKIIPKRLAGYNALELRRLLAYCYTELEQPEEARKEALEGIELAERAGDEAMGARLHNELGNAYLLARKTDLALEQFRLAHEAILHDIVRDPAFQSRRPL